MVNLIDKGIRRFCGCKKNNKKCYKPKKSIGIENSKVNVTYKADCL